MARTRPEQLHLVEHPLVSSALTVLRDARTPPAEFRTQMRLISRALAYEATIWLPVDSIAVSTPVADTGGTRVSAAVIAVPILRAGVGMLDGFLDVVPAASIGFVGLARDEVTLKPVEYYRNLRTEPGAHVYLLDPMLATGGSLRATLEGIELDRLGGCTIVSILASPEGVASIVEAYPTVRIVSAALDERLDDRGFIVPGLGDAGDRLCGTC